MASRQVGSAPGGTRKGPRDLTGKTKERLEAEAAEELAARAEQIASTNAVTAVKNSEVVDYTDEARALGRTLRQQQEEEEPVEVKPQKHKVRVLADIEDMVFGREVIDPGDFSDPNNIRYPVLGDLRFYTFHEGREYIVDDAMYQHLKALDYIWD